MDHEKAQNIKDKVIEIPVNVGIIQHQEIGACLIYAGLDQAYVHNTHGRIKGLIVKIYLEKVSREPKTHIAAILNVDACPL